MTDVLRTVGRYDLLEVIGRGGAAIVYLARQRDLERHVALKELAPIRAGDPTFAERFIAESRLAGSMNHANVVTVHEFFESDGVPYIAMEFLPRGSLRRYVGKLRMGQVAGVLEGVLAGLSHGERHGIVHRDLKPENLLVTEDGRVKIADFGVARAYNRAAPREAITTTGTTIGTPAYMAPEQALGKALTPATDLYSLGVIAWEMLAGRVPFEETDTPVAVLYRHVHEPIPPIRSIAPDVDPRLVSWLDRMLAKEPGERFAGADAAWEALEDVVLELLGPRWRREARLVSGDAGESPRPLTPATFDDTAQATKPLWRRRALAGLVVAALAGGGVAGGLAAASGGSHKTANTVDTQLGRILESLDRARAGGISRLRAATTARGQATAASEIASAYTIAAGQVAVLPRNRTSASFNEDLTSAARAYEALAAAAQGGNRPAYSRAAKTIHADEQRLQAAASRLP
jgi:tRNA A-37 threonylcarbamoyl transferase component Bud32